MQEVPPHCGRSQLTGHAILGGIRKKASGRAGETAQWSKTLAIPEDTVLFPRMCMVANSIYNSSIPDTSFGLGGHQAHMWCTYIHTGKTHT